MATLGLPAEPDALAAAEQAAALLVRLPAGPAAFLPADADVRVLLASPRPVVGVLETDELLNEDVFPDLRLRLDPRDLLAEYSEVRALHPLRDRVPDVLPEVWYETGCVPALLSVVDVEADDYRKRVEAAAEPGPTGWWTWCSRSPSCRCTC